MEGKVLSSGKHTFAYEENGYLEVINLESNRRHKVDEVIFHTPTGLFLMNVNGTVLFQFAFDDDTMNWIDDKIEVRIVEE
jgi:hypothetical protein